MKKEYIKPEAEMLKFVETEEIMTQTSFPGTLGSTEMPPGWIQ